MNLDSSSNAVIDIALYRIALLNGDDTAAIADNMRQHVINCNLINQEDETSAIEILNMLMPVFKDYVDKCTTEQEYSIVKAKFIDEYEKILHGVSYYSSESFALCLDYFWASKKDNSLAINVCQSIITTFKNEKFRLTNQYVLVHFLSVFTKFSHAALTKNKNVFAELVKSIKDVGIEDFYYGEHLPTFLG